MNIELYAAAAAGVATSIVLPVLVRSVREEFSAAVPQAEGQSRLARIFKAAWPMVRKYLSLLVFSLIMAAVIVAVGGQHMEGWHTAFLAGYAWDSTVQKITQKL